MRLIESQYEATFAARMRRGAIIADLTLAIGAALAITWLLTVGATLSPDAVAAGDRSGFLPVESFIALAFGGPTVWILITAAVLLIRRWKLAWLAHWTALLCALVFGLAAGFMLLPASTG